MGHYLFEYIVKDWMTGCIDDDRRLQEITHTFYTHINDLYMATYCIIHLLEDTRDIQLSYMIRLDTFTRVSFVNYVKDSVVLSRQILYWALIAPFIHMYTYITHILCHSPPPPGTMFVGGLEE